MELSKKDAVSVGLATAALAYGIHATIVPNAADIRASDAADETINNTERTATAITAGLVGTISLITKDSTVFIIGGLTVIALAWTKRAANLYDPVLGQTVAPGATTSASYTDGATMAAVA